MKFRFKLQPVLQQRTRAEDEQRRALSQLLTRRMEMHEQLRDMQLDITTDKQQMASSLTGRVDVDRIRQHAAHNAQVVVRADGVVMQLVELEQRIEQTRQQLIEASQQRKAIELLRDRQYQRWRQQRARKEAAMVDEMATQRYNHRGGGVA